MTKHDFVHEMSDIYEYHTSNINIDNKIVNNMRKELLDRALDLLNTAYKYLPEDGKID